MRGARIASRNDCTEGKNIGPLVQGLAAHLFWRHVANCPHYLRRCRLSHCRQVCEEYIVWQQLGQAEVQYLGLAGFRQEQVFWLQIAMDDSLVMSCAQPESNVGRNFDGFTNR